MKLLRTAKQPRPEHGDWRVPLDRPEEAEHLPPPEIGVWHRMKLKVESLRAAPLGPASAWGAEGEEPPIVPIAGWARCVRLLIAWCLLLPLSVVMVYALLLHLYDHADASLAQRDFWVSEPVWYSLLGAVAFFVLIIFRVVAPILVYVYVLGHELTHAIAAKMCLGKVQSLRIDMHGGYVETDADNLFIALSPYFVPLWMCCWMLILWAANFFFPFEEYDAWFYAGAGFWWSFHIYWTLWVIPREQPDMLENGLLFSLLLIMVVNVGILLGILYCFGVLSPLGYAQDFVFAARSIAESAADLWRFIAELF